MYQTEMKNCADLIPYARNPRKIDESAITKLASMIKEFGFQVPVVALPDNTVVDGHLRLLAAQKLKLKKVPVHTVTDWSEAKAKAFRIAVNQSATFAEWDTELLSTELIELKEFDYGLDVLGFDDVQIERFLHPIADDFIPDLPSDDEEKSDSNSYQITVQCKDEDEQQMIFLELRDRGLTVKAN